MWYVGFVVPGGFELARLKDHCGGAEVGVTVVCRRNMSMLYVRNLSSLDLEGIHEGRIRSSSR